MATAVIWRTAPTWLTDEQCATALGLSVAAFERQIAAGELRLEGKPGPGGRVLYDRDRVRKLILET